MLVEADRSRGWAIGFHYTERPDGVVVVHRRDQDGIEQHRLYQGAIEFRLEPLA